MITKEIIKRLPKVELHHHLDGAVRPSTIIELAEEYKVKLPETDPEKVTFIGNGSLMGARMSSLTNRIRKDVVEVTKKMTNFELSETSSYMDNYVAALFLPHTDINQFPKLKQRLQMRREMKN